MTQESPRPRSRWATFGWTLLAVVDGLFLLENTPAKSLPHWALWGLLALLVAGFVFALDRSGALTRADSAGDTPLGPAVRWRHPEFLAKAVVAGVTGGLLAVISPPLNWHLIHWLALVPMLWTLREDRFWENFALGWIYGAFALALIFNWVVETITLYSNIPELLAFGLLLLGAGGLFGWLYLPAWIAVHPLRRRFGVWWIALFPTVLVAAELFVSFVILFPYQMGVAHYRSPYVWQLASVTGVWGVSWLVSFFNAALAEAVYAHREGQPLAYRPVALAIAVLSLVVLWGSQRYQWVEDVLREGPTIRVAQMQSPHDMEFRLSQPSRRSFDEWVARTVKYPPGSVDLSVWPEGASPYDLNDGGAKEVIGQLAQRGQMEIIVGGGTRERDDDPTLGRQVRQFNSVFYFGEDGALRGRYDKMVPLLFGEYLPWWLTWLDDYVQGLGSFQNGQVASVFETKHGKIATPICYEAIFGSVCKRYKGAELLVNVTNDAWFGDTAEPHQHGMLAAIRSTELGIPVFRSTYSGISFVVEPHGNIHSETEPFTEVARVVEVRLGTVRTVYARFGDWFAWLCTIVGAIALGLAIRPGHVLSIQGQSREGSS